ncbi:hypothetical protein [Chryseobacterium bernardetii]|uniref:hypothetical protein n=1 Tax=Chryseobacterium bernardetii TaxID=1241978 RepID=UPI001629ABC2|nr:hypothetical protein [Chryseobacterium bernardetii]
MSRTRIVRGTYTKISQEGHNMYSNQNIITTAGNAITETGAENGVSYGEPKDPTEMPMVYGTEPALKGEVIFCNGFHSGIGGAINAAFNVTIGIEDRPWYTSDGDNTHHKDEKINTGDMKSPVIPSDIDKDIMDSSEILEAEEKPKEVYGLGFDWITGIKIEKKDSSYKKALEKFKGYWNEYRNYGEAVDLYTTFFNAEKRDHYINGSHGMGSPAWERECHGITLGYHWAVKNWKLKTKEEVEKEKEKNPNAESYSPAYRPLTFVGHSEGAAVAVGACIGAMYYAAERGWDEMAVNLILLGIHQPVALWSEEPYDKNRTQEGKYYTDYNIYKWFKSKVLEVAQNSPRMLNELYAKATEVESAVTPYGPTLAYMFTKDRNKQKYGIDEWTALLLGTDNWAQLKKRGVQFTFANDRADTVMLDGDIPGIANAKGGEDDTTLLGWKTWYTIPVGTGGLSPNSDFSIKVTEFDKGYMNTRLKISKTNPEKVTYLKTTYASWVDEFCLYHKKFKASAVQYEKKYKEPWTTGEVYMKENVILTNTRKAFEYAKVKDMHSDMMARYVWVHHVELEAHFAPVGYINRPEIFNLPDGKTRSPEWPKAEGNTIWDRIIKTAEDNADLFYRTGYGITFFNRNYKSKNIQNSKETTIQEQFAEVKKHPQQMRTTEKDYVSTEGKQKLINPQMSYNVEVEKWINIAKLEIKRKEEEAQKQKEHLEQEIRDIWIGPKF